jgi:hypothetical protein
VIPKPGKKPAGRLSALDIAKNTLKKARQKERKIKLSEMKNTLPEPPAGASTVRRLQNPDHVNIVKGMMNIPSARDMGLSMEGEEIHDKMMRATTGGQYSRYIARLCKGYRRVEPESYR